MLPGAHHYATYLNTHEAALMTSHSEPMAHCAYAQSPIDSSIICTTTNEDNSVIQHMPAYDLVRSDVRFFCRTNLGWL